MKKSSLDILTSDLDAWNGDRQPSLFLALVTGFVFWMGLIGLVLWIGIGSVRAEVGPGGQAGDPMVMKIYPDGTKLVLRWSEVGKTIDNGEKFGGAPRIVAYDPAKDGIVPIGEPSSKGATTLSTNAIAQGSSSVVTPDQPPKMNSFKASPDDDKASSPSEGFYIGLQPGGSVIQNINFEPITANGTIGGLPTSGVLDANLVLDAGFRFDLPIGYRVNEWFSVEFTPGFIFNPMNSVQLNSSLTIGTGTFTAGGTAEMSGNLIQVPLLLNFILTIPTDSSWEPFIGGGVGAIYSSAYFDTISGSNVSLYLDQEATCWSLGYSAMAGLNYHIGKDVSVGFVYKFTGTENQTFGGSTLGNLLNSTGTYTHSVAATATFRF